MFYPDWVTKSYFKNVVTWLELNWMKDERRWKVPLRPEWMLLLIGQKLKSRWCYSPIHITRNLYWFSRSDELICFQRSGGLRFLSVTELLASVANWTILRITCNSRIAMMSAVQAMSRTQNNRGKRSNMTSAATSSTNLNKASFQNHIIWLIIYVTYKCFWISKRLENLFQRKSNSNVKKQLSALKLKEGVYFGTLMNWKTPSDELRYVARIAHLPLNQAIIWTTKYIVRR